MKKILVPIDFSDDSKNALRVAAAIAQKSGASLEMLHVNLTTIYTAPAPAFASIANLAIDNAEYEAEAGKALERLKHEVFAHASFAGVPVVTRIKGGFFHSVVNEIAKGDKVDLIVIGTKGASGLDEFLLGSNTEKIVRTAPCPVLAVPRGTKEFSPKVVLMPSTLKDEQSSVFNYLASWDKLYNFHLKVLYLNNPAWQASDEAAEAQKNTFAKAAGLKNVDTLITNPSIYEDNSILGTAEQNHADLIVMGTHQRKGLSHFFFGSITEDTVNHSHLPVLAVPINGGW